MAELDNQRCKLQESADEVTRLKQLISAKDATIKELRASKKSIVHELETAGLAAKVAEETSVTLRAQRDRAMDKAIRAGRILMRRPGVVSMVRHLLEDVISVLKRHCYSRIVSEFISL
jgi:septal ring factor EnvC (AmiA/AmiB activator)